MMCLLGVLLGLLCLAVPCLTMTMHYDGPGIPGTMKYHLYMSTTEFVGTHTYPPIIQFADFVLAAIAFFLGVALASVTPLGGVSMALGMIDYYRVLSSKFDAFRDSFGGAGRIVTSIDWGAAFYIGILATFVTLLSFVFPVGPGYSEMYLPRPQGRGNLKERLLVWDRGKKPRGGV